MNPVAEYGKRPWATKDGRQMAWSEMTVPHLRNAANYIERAYADHLSALWAMPMQGEMALDALDSQITSLEEARSEKERYVQEMRAYADYRDQHQHVNWLKRIFS